MKFVPNQKSRGKIMSEVNRASRLELKRVEDPDPDDQFALVSKRVEDPDPDDQFALVLADDDGNSVTYLTTRARMKKVVIKFLHLLERNWG